MPHLSRQWCQNFASDTNRVQLTYDQGNAPNEVNRHPFLTRMREVCPSISSWLEYIYPTEAATKVVFIDSLIDSRSGGQQGCPLMMACHAMVQRMMLEGLGLVDPPQGSQITVPVLNPPARLDMTPCFADDGIIAGHADEVLRSFLHLRGIEPSLGLRFSSLVVAPTAGRTHMVDFGPFLEAGCSRLHY